MLIKDMFTKPIDRDIKGVVKVGQDDDFVIKQELEEYVVTNELKKHFRDFFSSYKRGINGNTDKMGVWISGFFGSGKSHFLKILSYLLENREVDGKYAIDYFLEDEKIDDPMVVADMKLASSISTDTILFNIDSKSETGGKKDEDSILNVFLKVFNEKLGYSTNPHVADLERQLDEEGIYEEFKEKYREKTDENWVEHRNLFNFFRGRVVDTLVEIGFMDRDSAMHWSEGTVATHQISIYRFCEMINDYINKKGDNHHIVFLVDEMGQYIGENTDLMLNLQTITEDLGTLCQGRAWIVVTSQQDIDSITEVKGRDFSKIQGRFDTRLSLTSANVDEVIKLRILEKTETANQTLSVLYENKETIIKNLLTFDDEIEKKLYENKEDFCQVYPFIPYQFNILASVLTSIRKHGASGKHLSEGERSMLALFKESAEKFMDYEDGTIVPFNIFYGALNKFLDHSHSVVVSRALDNKMINPEEEEDNFNVNVLKTLFMIKYVKEIEPNIENITTLMVSNIDDDRILLKEKVENALDILVRQMLVQKNGDFYIFLTDEEQEINREIENQDIQSSDVVRKVSELIFADIYHEDKLRVPGFKNRYAFGFNRFIDEVPYRGNQSFDFGIKIITPYSDLNGSEARLKMLSGTTSDVYVELPSDLEFLNELKLSMKIEKFLNSSSSRNVHNFEEIRMMKRREMTEHEKRSRSYLKSSLEDSNFYVNGDKLEFKSTDFKNNLTESLERLVSTVFHKLNYITKPMDESDIYNLFERADSSQIRLESESIANENAIREVLDYIKLSTQNHTKISLREIKNRFTKAPYGFLDLDIEWIIAKAFTDGETTLTLNGKVVSLLNQKSENIIDYITKRKFVEKLLIEIKETIPERKIRSLRLVSKEALGMDIVSEDTDRMIYDFNKFAEGMINHLEKKLAEYGRGNNYPGEDIIKEGIKLIQSTTNMESANEVFDYVEKHEEDYLDFSEDYPEVRAFLDGDQKNIWERTEEYMDIFEKSSIYIFDEEIESIIGEMKEINKMSNPYNNIKRLPELNEKFMLTYNEILSEQFKPVEKHILEEKERVINSLERNELEGKFSSRFNKSFNELMEKAINSNNLADLNGFKPQAEILRDRFLNEIIEERERLQKESEKDDGDIDPETKTTLPVKRHVNLSIRSVNNSNSWQIETKEDIDKYLQELKENLEKEIKENTILNIEF